MLNTHKCLLESGVEIQKRLESHPASKRIGLFRRPHSASQRDTPKKLTKGQKRVGPCPPESQRKGKGSTSPSYVAVTRGQTPRKDREWQLVQEKKKKEGKRSSCALCAGNQGEEQGATALSGR